MTDNIIDFYNQEVFPKLTIDLVYSGIGFTAHRGKYWRACCPIHKGDNPTAFSVNVNTLAWHCFTHCGKGSVLAFVNGGIEPRGKSFVDIVYRLADLANIVRPIKYTAFYRNSSQTSKSVGERTFNQNLLAQKSSDSYLLRANPPVSPIIQSDNVAPIQSHNYTTHMANDLANNRDIIKTLKRFQSALPGSLGEKYLLHRKIPLSLAQQYGLGYAPFTSWPNKHRDWKWGRLVFPHSNPNGDIINLYGRAIGSLEAIPKYLRHDHLPGSKGYFNGQIMQKADHLFICEGSFDAISLIAAGFSNSIAIFGLHGWRWDWSYNVKKLIFALDNDLAGSHWRELARQGCLRGKKILFVPAEAYGGKKDVNEAWIEGVLKI